MQRKILPGTDISLPRLGFGAMRLPVNEDESINYEKAEALFDYALKSGVNYFDTAFGYHNGKSAEFVGNCLSKYERSSYFLANKMPPWCVKEPADLEKIFEKQLCDLKTDFIDFYLLHALSDDNYQKMIDLGAYDFCIEKKKNGIIRYMGFSFHGSLKALDSLIAYGKSRNGWDFIQIQFNYLDYFSGNAKAEYDMITAAGIPVIVMEPVRGGKLAGLPSRAKDILANADPGITPAELALRWVAGFDNVVTILSGMSNEEQVKENIETLSLCKPLDEKLKNAAYDVANEIRRIKTIPCTACNYCTEVCPAGIKIPYIFDRYNKYLDNKDMAAFKNDCEENCPEGTRASDCLVCGACVEKCPQKIEIPDILSLMPITKKD